MSPKRSSILPGNLRALRQYTMFNVNSFLATGMTNHFEDMLGYLATILPRNTRLKSFRFSSITSYIFKLSFCCNQK